MTRCQTGSVFVLALWGAGCMTVSDPGGGAGESFVGFGGTGGNSVAVVCEESLCPCTEAGIRAAIAEGGGPFTFDCDGPTTIFTKSELLIDKDVVLDGRGELTIHGNDEHRVFRLFSSDASLMTVELRRMHITGGSGTGGAGITSAGILTLDQVTVSGNRAFFSGGGILQYGGAAALLTLRESTVSGNHATTGGGIFNESALVIERSTIRFNSATETGGGITSTGRSLRIINSTISSNQATENGGGVYVVQSSGSAATIGNSTVAGNEAAVGSALYWNDRVVPIIASSLIYENECESEWPGGQQAVFSVGYNIESPSDTCGFAQPTDLAGIAPAGLKLMSLQANRGPTETHALLAGSVAVDRIPGENCQIAEDQRQVARPQGNACDVGAFELEQP